MKITKDEFLTYESVRRSGVTNMWDTRVVQRLSGLTKEKILEIIKNYNTLANKYL